MKQLNFARQLRTQQTDAENLLWSRLRAHRLLGLKFRRQQPVGTYVVDFFCPEQRLVVELDGGQHQERAGYDQSRDTWLKAEGYIVLRYWNNELMSNLDGVLEDILQRAGLVENGSPSPQPLSPEGRRARNLDNLKPRLAPLSLEGRGVGGEGGAAL
jgi:very-short-patch-repair endonuclease